MAVSQACRSTSRSQKERWSFRHTQSCRRARPHQRKPGQDCVRDLLARQPTESSGRALPDALGNPCGFSMLQWTSLSDLRSSASLGSSSSSQRTLRRRPCHHSNTISALLGVCADSLESTRYDTCPGNREVANRRREAWCSPCGIVSCAPSGRYLARRRLSILHPDSVAIQICEFPSTPAVGENRAREVCENDTQTHAGS